MIPSDHFVRFYNEVFKFLDGRDGLADFYCEISRHQDFHCLELFRSRGLQGVYEYYCTIRKEENCDMDIQLNGHELTLRMNVCPSLSKAMDNDAGLCRKYCLHCPGWVQPVYARAGLFEIYDVGDLEQPRCTEWIYDDREAAREKYRALAKTISPERLFISFEP
ncbi:MAG: hypothetical protein MR051_07190 [Lentisphaeria bacterium]|nr:hypothetical protein [Lentisphaeria bacterium]